MIRGKVAIPNVEVCRIQGMMRLGGACKFSQTGVSRKLTFEELIDMLEARPEKIVNGVTIPAHGAALIFQPSEFEKYKTAFDQACTLLKSRCTEEVRAEFNKVFDAIVDDGKKPRPRR